MKVVLLDPEWDQTVHLTAHLASAGIDVTLVSSRPADRLGLAGYCRQVLPPRGVADPEFLETLLGSTDADWVIPLGEDLMELLWRFPEERLARVFPHTSREQRAALTDRRTMYELTASLGIPTPALLPLADREALQSAIQQLGLPLVLRGTQGLAGEQVRVVTDAAAAREAYELLQTRSPAPPFAQAFVSGRRCLIGGLFHRGEMLQWFSQTTIEAITPTGPSLRVQSLKDERLTSYAARLFKRLQWTGLACAEFIATEAGEYHFLEVNPRPWAAIQAAHCCGVPLMRSFGEYLLGRMPASDTDFPNGKQITLFPQLIIARMRAGRRPTWSDRRAYLQSAAHAPWRHPRLLLYFCRKIWWARGQAAPAAAKATAVPMKPHG